MGFLSRIIGGDPKKDVVDEKSYDELIQELVDYCTGLDPKSDEYQSVIDKIDVLNKAKVELTEANAKAHPGIDWGTGLKVAGSIIEVFGILGFEYYHVMSSRNALTRSIKL